MGLGGHDGRLRITTAVAAAAHALGLALIATRPVPVAAPPPPPAEVAPILVELEPETPVLRAPDVAALPSPEAPVGTANAPGRKGVPRRARVTAGAGSHPGDTAPAESAGADAIAAAPVTEAPAGSAQASAKPDRLPPPLLPLALHAPAAVLATPLGVVQASAVLTAGAQVMATAQKLAEGSGPAQGHATIRVTVEEDGSVSGVVVSGVGWEAAGQRIRAALAGRRLRVPAGAHGVVISLAVDAWVTRVPPVLTGEARATTVGFDSVHGGIEDQHRGFGTGASNAAVIDPRLLAPFRRRVVKVELVGEQPR